ncbi:hypothetical protein ACFE04_018680 [Oxalis oulophora]
MWALLSTATTTTLTTNLFPTSTTTTRPFYSTSATGKPAASTVSIKSLPSNSKQSLRLDTDVKSNRQQLSGADVLWALQQRAAATSSSSKNNNKLSNNTKSIRKLTSSSSSSSSSSVGRNRVDNGVDYANVRPLNVKSDWGFKLQELENRLRQLMETST